MHVSAWVMMKTSSKHFYSAASCCQETVENENYLGLRIYRFYIRCTKCISEITFKVCCLLCLFFVFIVFCFVLYMLYSRFTGKLHTKKIDFRDHTSSSCIIRITESRNLRLQFIQDSTL